MDEIKYYEFILSSRIDWTKIDNRVFFITGATGLVGKYLVELLLYRNKRNNVNTKVIACGRDINKLKDRFNEHLMDNNLLLYEYDVCSECSYNGHVDVVVHMASNTHPRLYATQPVMTEMANIFGTYNMLNLTVRNPGSRFVLASSGDVYGDNRSAKDLIEEDDCGYINCNTLRAGYIEGKRASEALCNAFKEEKGCDFVIARLCRIYGPTMQIEDSKAISQFIKKSVYGEDIILKSEGNQTFSYLYISDVVSAILTILSKGISGEAYNVADSNQNIRLKDLALILAQIGRTNVIFELPDDIESKGASSFQNVKLSSGKLELLGWSSNVQMHEGLKHTVECLRKEKICLKN